MSKDQISNELMKLVKKAQIDEEQGSILYEFMAKKEKNEENKKILIQMSKDEKKHAEVWKNITKKDLKPSKFAIFKFKFLTIVMGITFVIKTMQKKENLAQHEYEKMMEELPEAAKMLEDERRHEKELYNMIDEERLNYIGAMVLGLNDALVELTGAIAGVTFALANAKLVALTGIVTGISATFSMAASNYLAERADNNPKALKSSIYTGMAYLITVALLVLPYLLLPEYMYIMAFAIMIAIVILIIMFFNYYISVAKEEPFLKNFATMAIISLSVAVISYIIGILAKKILGIDTI
ncbi:MAG: VIT1/CCC1 transporter family protein [Clostridia bacterium]|nr:VIT1/CCC1 transporter family protein [Clostridia bacterium]